MKKMDEMEMNINLSAIKWSWGFTAIALGAWSVYDLIQTPKISVASCLFAMQIIIYFFAGQVFKSKAMDEGGRKYILCAIGCFLLFLIFGGLFYFSR